ncbi:MAG: hypothetical protein Q8R91_06820 [Candidatus Omnitrophota bacterium]|nr:hypothetical protein [Candidatus Omnitrophota bacterium]
MVDQLARIRMRTLGLVGWCVNLFNLDSPPDFGCGTAQNTVE